MLRGVQGTNLTTMQFMEKCILFGVLNSLMSSGLTYAIDCPCNFTTVMVVADLHHLSIQPCILQKVKNDRFLIQFQLANPGAMVGE